MKCGLRPHDIERLLRRRDLVRILPGVFIDHTGRPSWLQRAWAGTLYYAPAALAGDAALGMNQRGPIDIAIDESRRCDDLPGYRVRRVRDLAGRIQPSSSPPRMRIEEAALDAALLRVTDLDAIGLLADICRSRRTTARRILATLDGRARVPRRQWFVEVLTDIADGTCSALEHGYLDRVERPHGLPLDIDSTRDGRASAYRCATSTTTRLRWWSSSTGGTSTTPPASAIATWTATSTPRSTAGRRSGSGGARCSDARA